jgi:hypothetical protein
MFIVIDNHVFVFRIMAKKYSTDHNLQGLWEEGIVVLSEYLFLARMSFLLLLLLLMSCVR